jgi:hypothetical protein
MRPRHEVEVEAIRWSPDGTVEALWVREAVDGTPEAVEATITRPAALSAAPGRQGRVVGAMAAGWLALVLALVAGGLALVEAVAR